MYLGPKIKSEKIGFKFSYAVIIVQLIIVTLSAKSSLILVENKAGFPKTVILCHPYNQIEKILALLMIYNICA